MNRDIIVHWMNGTSDGKSTQDAAFTTFFDKAHLLPTFAEDREFRYHRDYEHCLAGPQWIPDVLKVGADKSPLYRLPGSIVSTVRGLVHHYRKGRSGIGGALRGAYNAVANAEDDQRASLFLQHCSSGPTGTGSVDADWFHVELAEPDSKVARIRHQELGGYNPSNPYRLIRFHCDLEYDLRLFVGKGIAPSVANHGPDFRPGDVKASGQTPMGRWFKMGWYVPQVFARARMAPDTYHLFMQMIGLEERPDGTTLDNYWRLNKWERTKEASKAVAAFPKFMKDRKGDAVRALYESHTGSAHPLRGDSSGASSATYAAAAFQGETRRFNRKTIPPRGWVFVKYNTFVKISVVGLGW
ncbi:MAG: hypothetical protein R3E12_19290 [Candidatus Eisenbacteria bacterium]|uniref:Uncharacterized protein n=1 Tax=Eiseniibacteriota bacterium TaxID=2212470 RepID=A0A956RPA0_UNCEI|nr:hypothetical protein [Candidatus Eisenbacteria bacterium]